MKRLRGRLNLFQATMLDWRELHPYVAVHAARIAQPLDVAALTKAIADALSHAGLTALELDRASHRYAWHGGPAGTRVDVITAGSDWQSTLAQAIERQLNAPFALDGQIDPFRFFAVDMGDAFFLCLAYDHFIAGGDSIIVLLNTIADRYAGHPAPAAPLSLYPRTHWRLFARIRGDSCAARPPSGTGRQLPQDRSAALSLARGRVQRVRLLHARPTEFRAVRDAAKDWGLRTTTC